MVLPFVTLRGSSAALRFGRNDKSIRVATEGLQSKGPSENVENMSRRYFDHIDLRVRDRTRAQAFYSRILPALGFTSDESGEKWGAFQVPEPNGVANEFFAFDEDPNHRPNESRIAFWAESRQEVDRLAGIVTDAGALNLEGPQMWTEYTPGYYAIFFEDPDGNKLEVCHRERPIVAE